MKGKSVLKQGIKLAFVGFAVTAFVACQGEPQEHDLFVGTYHGKVTYSNNKGISKRNNNGKVTLSKVGSNHDFYFSDDIPAIKGIKIETDKDDKNTFHAAISTDGTGAIKIEDGHLTIGYTKALKETWTADAKRQND